MFGNQVFILMAFIASFVNHLFLITHGAQDCSLKCVNIAIQKDILAHFAYSFTTNSIVRADKPFTSLQV